MFVAAIAIAAAVQPNLAKLILNPSVVGKGYDVGILPAGLGAADRTLDLCGVKNYPSESLRTARIQVGYKKTNGKLELSNELVRYKSGGAADAMKEVAQHVATCPSTPIAFEGQPPLVYKISRIADPKLLPGALALRLDVSGTVKGKKVHAIRFAVYQRIGNTLSGIYSYVTAPGVTVATQEAFALHAADASAKVLRSRLQPQGSGPPA
jgi:hypothetical protein